MKHVVVASKNPAKLQAVQDAFARVFPDEQFEIEGVSVDSGVSDQPMSDDETFRGAANRVKNASAVVPDADFYVGLEGGLEKMGDELLAFAWMVVLSGDGILGKSRTSAFVLPQQVAELIHAGKELGEADDIVFGTANSKQQNGAVGILSNNVVTRSSYYSEALVLALIPFQHPSLY